MLVNAGFFGGHAEDLMPANEANPLGYYENLRIYRANEQVLEGNQIANLWNFIFVRIKRCK